MLPNNFSWGKVIDGVIATIDMKLDEVDVVNRSLAHPTSVLAQRNDTHLVYQVFRLPPPVERRRRWNPGPGVTEYGVVLSAEGVGVWRV